MKERNHVSVSKQIPVNALRVGHGLLRGQSSMRCCTRSGGQCGGLDVIELGEVLVQVGLALLLNFALVGPTTAGCTFAVAGVQGIHDVHSFGDLAKRGKAHAVQARVVGQIDEQLSGAGVRAGSGEGEEVFFIALSHWVVLDGGLLPDRVQSRICTDSKLRDETGEHTKKTLVIKKMMPGKIVKAVRS